MAIRFVNPSGSNTSPYDTEVKAATVIQTALTGASSEDIIAIRADADYVIGSTLNIPDVQMLAVVAYKTTSPTVALFDGDMSRGGASYKSEWGVIDTNGGAFAGITYLGNTQLLMLNIKIINVPTTQVPIDWDTNGTVLGSGVGVSILLDNCWLTGGNILDFQIANNSMIVDSKITGSWANPSATKTFAGCLQGWTGGHIWNNFFKIDAGEGYINTLGDPTTGQDNGLSIVGNIFTLGAGAALDKEMVRIRHGANVFNNVFYQPIGTILGDGGENRMLVTQADVFYQSIYNNIFMSAETGGNRSEGIALLNANSITFQKGYNCLFNTINTNYTLASTDIEGDPLFVNPQADDFRLKPGSPCIATGQPSTVGLNLFNESNIGTDTGISATVNANIPPGLR